MNVADQSALWMHQLETRKRNPASAATLATYRSGLRNWILPRLGTVELADVKNGVLKRFVSDMADAKLSPASINLWTNCVKDIVASATDQDGERLFHRNWSNEFIDLPILEPGSQRQPSITAEQAQTAINQAQGVYKVLYCVLAATGLRIGEALALRAGDNQRHTSWWPVERVIRVRTSVWRGEEQHPKTSAAIRDVDIPEELNDYLVAWMDGYEPGRKKYRVAFGEPMFQSTVQKRLLEPAARRELRKTGIPGFHCFRRWRLTRLRAQGAPEDLVKFWIGHGKKDITDRYSKLAQDIELRREWVKRVGLGFKLPEEA